MPLHPQTSPKKNNWKMPAGKECYKKYFRKSGRNQQMANIFLFGKSGMLKHFSNWNWANPRKLTKTIIPFTPPIPCPQNVLIEQFSSRYWQFTLNQSHD